MDVSFLQADDVIGLHAAGIRRWGGDLGLRDAGLLFSALAQPAARFDGRFLHPELADMGGAYLFHLVKNHPFIDGNKRVGFLCAHTFLKVNGRNLNPQKEPSNDELFAFVSGVASGELSEPEVLSKMHEWYSI